MWHSDPQIHNRHTAIIKSIARISIPSVRYLKMAKVLESLSATSELSAERFRSFACVLAQAAQDPGLFVKDVESPTGCFPPFPLLPEPHSGRDTGQWLYTRDQMLEYSSLVLQRLTDPLEIALVNINLLHEEL